MVNLQVLVITGCNLRSNFSAGLSHNSFISGLCKLGYEVDVLCFSDKNIKLDLSINLPPIRCYYTYDGQSLYEQLSIKKMEKAKNEVALNKLDSEVKISFKSKACSLLKEIIHSCYGVYRTSIVWYHRAKKFSSQIDYDYVISMSDPPVSHKLASFLLKHNKIHADKWIQLWEDPWCDSFYRDTDINIPCMKEEQRLLSDAQDIVYVTPLTLKRQQDIFPNEASKMRWCPLATYYQTQMIDYSRIQENQYGYFGDYVPHIRNLEPFYSVAVEKNLCLDICGSPTNLFKSTGNIHIYPRLPLSELKIHEDKANVVVCLFNCRGGQIPGKIYQLAATNKTILCILDGTKEAMNMISDYFGKFNRFIFCFNNTESISHAIDDIENKRFGKVSNRPIFDFNVKTIARQLLGENNE